MLHRKPCRKKQSGARCGPLRAPPSGPLAHNQYTEYESGAPRAPRMLYYTVIKYIQLYTLYANVYTFRVKRF